MVKLLGMPGVDKSEEGLIFGVGEGLISSFHHTVGKKIGRCGEMEAKSVDIGENF